VFDSFKSYQIHNQTFHGRTVFVNSIGAGAGQLGPIHRSISNGSGFNHRVGGHIGHLNGPGPRYLNGHHTVNT